MTADPEHKLLDAFDEHWDDYRKQFKQGRQELSEDAVHDLRVSARRMQAMLGIVRSLDRRPRVKKLGRFLRKQLQQLDTLRDTQVLVQETEQSLNTLPHLIAFRHYLQNRSDDLARAGGKQLRKRKPSDLKQRVNGIRRVVKRHVDDETLVENVLVAVDEAYAKTLARFHKVDAGDPNSIHRVRVAFKRLRYMIETVEPFLPDYPGHYPDKMHDYQDAMGKVHDTMVYLDTLKEFQVETQKHNRSKEPDFDLKPAETYFRTRLADLIRAYFQRKDELSSFWRPAPGQPFPWEKSHEPVHRTTRNRRTAGSAEQRGTGQPAASHRRRAKKVPADRASPGQPGNADRSDPDQSVPTGS